MGILDEKLKEIRKNLIENRTADTIEEALMGVMSGTSNITGTVPCDLALIHIVKLNMGDAQFKEALQTVAVKMLELFPVENKAPKEAPAASVPEPVVPDTMPAEEAIPSEPIPIEQQEHRTPAGQTIPY